MPRLFGAVLVLLAALGIPRLEAGFRSPESLVRNVYAYYGNGSPEFSGGLPHDTLTTQQFFDPGLHNSWASAKPPYDFLVQSASWKLGGISIAVTRRQYDKTYVAVAFRNNGRAVTRHYHPMTVDSFARRQYTVGRSGAIFYRKHPELGGFLGVHELETRTLADERKLSHLRRRARLGERFRVLATNRVFETLMREHYLRGLRDGLDESQS